MSRVRVKICGVTTAEAVEAAVAAGADAIGFVFAAGSPRRIDLDAAHRLAALVPPFVARVAVLRYPTEADVRAVLDRFRPDFIQAEPSDEITRALSPGTAVESPARLLPVLHDAPDLLDRWPQGAPAVLLEPGGRGGRGIAPDAARAAALARRVHLVLAGGLTPENVGAAIAAVRPFAVDVSSGVESSPGVKDPRRIAAFLAAVTSAATLPETTP